jgi:PAS domain-containing protein
VRTETRLRRKDGQRIDLAFSAALVDPERPELGVVHTLLDITAQRRAEQLLRARIATSSPAYWPRPSP